LRPVHEFGLIIGAVKFFQYEIEQTKPQPVTRVFLFYKYKKILTCYKELFCQDGATPQSAQIGSV
jgi:hypothetical protein